MSRHYMVNVLTSWGTDVHGRFLEPFRRVEDRYATSALPGELVGTTLEGMEPSSLGAWPVRAVWGMADPMVGAGELARWKQALPHLEVVEVEDAGHFVAHEAPDAIASVIRALK